MPETPRDQTWEPWDASDPPYDIGLPSMRSLNTQIALAAVVVLATAVGTIFLYLTAP